MKKIISAAVLTLVLILSIVSCSNAPSQVPKTDSLLTGKIVQIYDNSVLVAGKEAYDLYMISSKLKIYDTDSKAVNKSALKAGQEIEIGYSGGVMESYPAQLSAPAYIKIIRQGDDLVGFYQTVLNDLWKVDEGLNSDIHVLAFDLTQVVNLSESEKSALIYVVSGIHGLQGVAGTFEELGEQGYIDQEKLLFKDGMLLKFELTDVTEDRFTFNVTKWRSGDGAYFFNDCKARKEGNDWSYSVGSEMIS